MQAQPVLVELLPTDCGRRIGRLTLNIEKTLNSLTREMVDILHEQLLAWRSDDTVVAVFIDGAGEKGLCAGGDVQALHASSTGTPGGPCEYAESFFEQEYRMNFLLHTYLKPVVCWGHGIVMGGGLGVMAACNHRVVTARTRIAMPEVTIALFPDVGGSWFLNRMPGESGLFLALTAASINAADAIFTGIADVFLGNEHRENVVQELQAAAWGEELDSHHDCARAVLNSFAGLSADPMPAGNVEPHLNLINAICDRESLPKTVAAILALDDEYTWLARARDGLSGGSPLASAWIHRQLVESRDHALAEVFRSELRLATNIMRDAEFGEGVRALLIDKDRNPLWQYAEIADIPDQVLDSFFAEPWPANPLDNLV